MESENTKKVNPFVEKCRDAISNFLLPFKKFKEVYSEAKTIDKVFIILNFFINGIFDIKTKLFGRGLGFLAAEAIMILYISTCSGFFIGDVDAEFSWLITVSYVLVAIYLVFYYQCFRSGLVRLHDINNKRDVKESSIIEKVKKIGLSLNKYRKEVAACYRYGNGLTKLNIILSYIVIGIPQMIERQYIKGVCFFLIEVGYILFMYLIGAPSIIQTINLNELAGEDRRAILVYFIVTLIFTLLFVFVYIVAQRMTIQKEIRRVNKKPLLFKDELKELSGPKAYFIYLILPILGAVAFTIIPIVFMILVGFTDYNSHDGVGISTFEWAGLDAFRSLFDMGSNFSTLASVFSWTMVWAFLATFTCYFGGFFLAILLNNKLVKIKPVWRSIFVIIMAVPQFVSLKLMNTLFSETGPVNQWIVSGGGSAINFWGDEMWAKTLIIIVNMWVGIPYNMLLISGLLLNIPKDNYEAADIEGANKVQQFFKITFPYIFFMTTPLLITSFVNNINNFNVIWLLIGEGGGVVQDTDIMITWLYKLTISNGEYNIGSAIGMIMFVISATISLVIFRNSSAYKSEEEFR